jgi:pyridoxal phosphate enzyme (YggS family)
VPTEIQTRYQNIQTQIAQAAPAPEKVTLIAVSKTQPADAVEALYRLGHRDFGENYVQELVAKAKELEDRGCTGIRWHFIGHLQTNKVKALLPCLHTIHTVDSEKLARELAKRWKEAARPGKLPVFIEVNIDQEDSKAGLPPSEAPALAQKLSELPELDLQGLMCIPAVAPGTQETAPTAAFTKLRELETQCRPYTQGQLSMGMSADFEAALHEGATHIRLGTILFGPRQPKAIQV